MARSNEGEPTAIDKLIAAMMQDQQERAQERQERAQERQERAQPTDDALRRLDLFERRNPPRFKGGYDPEGAQHWLRELEKIFGVIQCEEVEKVSLAAYTLSDDAEHWWNNTRSLLREERVEITWAVFQEKFLEKYFPRDIREKKEVEFLTLTQGSMSVGEYAAKFEELSRYYPHYHNANGERSKCVKFESGLRPEIKEAIRLQEIRQFSILVNKCRIFEEDHKERLARVRNYGPQRSQRRGFDRRKPYQPPQHASGSSSGNFQKQAVLGALKLPTVSICQYSCYINKK